MNTSKTDPGRILGFILYAAGIVFGLVVFGFSSWADFEAFLYDTALSAETRLRTMRCPYMIALSEESSISASFTNGTDRRMRRTVRFRVTDGLASLLREDRQRFELEPGESIRLEWSIYGDDAVYGRFVLARVYLYRAYPNPSSTASCGVLLLPVTFISGSLATALTLVVYVALTGSGLFLWSRQRGWIVGKTLEVRNAMVLAGAFILAGLVFGILGWWVVQEFLFLITVMMVVIAALYFLREAD